MENKIPIWRGWKALAIVFIILFTLETIAVVTIIKIGTDQVSKENKCQINICGNELYNSYYFDSPNNLCYCYTNSEITHKEILK